MKEGRKDVKRVDHARQRSRYNITEMMAKGRTSRLKEKTAIAYSLQSC